MHFWLSTLKNCCLLFGFFSVLSCFVFSFVCLGFVKFCLGVLFVLGCLFFPPRIWYRQIQAALLEANPQYSTGDTSSRQPSPLAVRMRLNKMPCIIFIIIISAAFEHLSSWSFPRGCALSFMLQNHHPDRPYDRSQGSIPKVGNCLMAEIHTHGVTQLVTWYLGYFSVKL